MSSRRSWSFIAAHVIIVAVTVTACRSEPNTGLPTDEPTPAVGDALAEVEEEPPEKEVTRIVVETEVVEVTPEPLPIEPAKKELTGKIASAHGNSGAVRAIFYFPNNWA